MGHSSWFPGALMCTAAWSGLSATANGQTNGIDTLMCEGPVKELYQGTFFHYAIDEWTLRKPWDHYGELFAEIVSTSSVELDPKQRFKLTDSTFILITPRFYEELGCLEEAIERTRYYPLETALEYPGTHSKRKKSWAFNRWRIYRDEWSGIRLLLARANLEYLRHTMFGTMECLDAGDRTWVNIAVALPIAEP